MPDSEDDYDRRNRDKFAREREFGERSRARDFNQDRGRRDYSNGIGIKRAGMRRDEEPPLVKRNRYDSASDSFEPQFIRKDEQNSSVMLTFKKFLNTQDETLSDEEAIAKYMEYKMEFKKQECERYFQQHKDEEWFRLKYHPDQSKALKEEKKENLQKRLDVFNMFVENGFIDNRSLDYLNAADIVRLLDATVIKLEDGLDAEIEGVNDEDLDDESVIEILKLKETEKSKSNGSHGNDASLSDTVENGNATEKNGAVSDDNADDEAAKKKKPQLHKTCSIFFKTVPLSSSQADLENICKQHPGFLRIGLADPVSDSKHRHGWVTYRRDVNIKEIFWSLKNAKLNGSYLGAVVNRDLKRKIRPVSGITFHRSVVQNDVRHAAMLIAFYDHRGQLFIDPDTYEPLTDLEQAIISSKNPVLSGIVEFLVEEESAEEETLLGLSGNPSDDIKIPLEVDKAYLNVLDKLILYLRIVHSVDYYNCGEYLNEDNMPNRIGILHVRGVSPSKDDSYVQIEKSITLVSKKFVDNFVSNFNERLSSTLLKNAVLTDEELEKLGKKDAEKAVEDFISQNCVELSKEKWLCPLSGKKFKGPEFIHKHLHSKHADKLSEVRNEVLFFNNYLLDPLRPHNEASKFPSSPTNSPAGVHPPATALFTPDFERRSNDFGYNRNNWNNGGPRGFNNRGFQGGNRDFGNRSRYFDPTGGADNGGRRDPRPQVAYRDLDAPEEIF